VRISNQTGKACLQSIWDHLPRLQRFRREFPTARRTSG
jgi:hypothetical protein